MADLAARFKEVFGPPEGLRTVRAPGRVNLIGEHTDYNDGFVMPMALARAVRIALVPHETGVVRLWSEQFAERAEFAFGQTPGGDAPHWLRYPMAVAAVLAEEGLTLRGFQGVVDGDVPVGAGLSSSAACEVAAALALLVAAKPDIEAGPAVAVAEAHGLTGGRLARLCQAAEHRVGVRCGIMDQFISVHGRAGHAVMLDCRDLSHRPVPLPAEAAAVVVIDSRVQRKLTAGAYNERRSQCEDGAARLKAFDPAVESLRDVSRDLFEAHAEALPETVRRRCRHVVTENARVRQSVEALEAGDLAGFGRLVSASHDSLRDDYEVSGPELDLLVTIAREVDGVFGSRLTGAGFGGCTVSLVRPDAVDDLRNAVLARYPAETGLEPRIWTSPAADGAAVET
ncbi:MAG: galactokinase [Phycisphaerae bacterium]